MVRLEKPVLDLNLTRTSPGLTNVGFTGGVAALPGGGAVIGHHIGNNRWTEQILKINSQGKVTQTIYTGKTSQTMSACKSCSKYIWGRLVLGDFIYLTHLNGTVIKTRVSNGQVVTTSTIPEVIAVFYTGSLSNKLDKIPDKQTLLLCDRNQVFTFKPSTGEKQVRITGLRYPQSVSYFFYNHTVFYIVCELGRHRINVYNQTWHLIRTIGTYGSNDGELNHPESAIVSDEDTIFISDWFNHRVSEFNFNGTFLRHLLVRSDGIYRPFSMSYYYPHLWLVHGDPHMPYRYNLYRLVYYLYL